MGWIGFEIWFDFAELGLKFWLALEIWLGWIMLEIGLVWRFSWAGMGWIML